MRRGALLALMLLAACGSARPALEQPGGLLPPQHPGWCGAVDSVLAGGRADTARFRCLGVPNFLVTGFYGTLDNPERSDFVDSCFAGNGARARRVQLAARPAGDLAFEYTADKSLDAGGGLDLSFIGPWAPKVGFGNVSSEHVAISVTLGDAEIRVLPSVAEILGQEYDTAANDPLSAAPLEGCIASLCDDSAGGGKLVYTAKVLAAVPVIRVRFDTARASAAQAAIAGGIVGFNVAVSKTEHGTFEIRSKDKLNIAALLEEARPAFDRAGTCQKVTIARTRRQSVASLKALGVQLLARRDLPGVGPVVEHLRAVVTGPAQAFSQDEQLDLLATLEAIEAASHELDAQQPDKALCEARALLDHVLAGDGSGNRLHDVLSEVAQPIAKRLTAVANDHSLPCADPAWYLDADRDGYGDRSHMLHAPQQPEGYVANALDCYDGNASAHPGQTMYFNESRGDGSFDYDCDGTVARKDELVSAGCKSLTTFGYPTHCWADAGWQESVPDCGHEGRWLAECEVSGFSCSVVREQRRQQECR